MIRNNLTNDCSLYRGELAKNHPRKGVIKDLIVKGLDVNIDDRGLLSEICRLDWQEVFRILASKGRSTGYVDLIQQIYIVQNHSEAIRAFHVHEELIDLFCVVNGYAKFIFIDNRTESQSFANYEIVNVSDKDLTLIGVPAGVFHGWKGSAGCTMVSIASRMYKGEGKKAPLDELRIPWNYMGERIWETEFK